MVDRNCTSVHPGTTPLSYIVKVTFHLLGKIVNRFIINSGKKRGKIQPVQNLNEFVKIAISLYFVYNNRK